MADPFAKQKEDSAAMIQLLQACNLMELYNMHFPEGGEGQVSDRVRGPVNIEWIQDKVSSCSREFYTTMFWNGSGDSIWVFWAGGESGNRRAYEDRYSYQDMHCSLGCKRRFACDIPNKLTFNEDGTLPDELKESFAHCVVKMGFASFGQDMAHMYLVVIPDEYKCHQHRFSQFVANPELLYGLGTKYGEKGATSGVSAAAKGSLKTLAEKMDWPGLLAAAGASEEGATLGTDLAIAGIASGIKFIIVRGIKAYAGHELHYVTTQLGGTAASLSIDMNLDKSNKQGGTMVGKKDIIWI